MAKVLVKSAWGSDPTKAAFAFLHGNALAEAGHEVQIFLRGEAVSLMRDPVARAVVPLAGRHWRRLFARPSRSAYRSTSEARARGLVESSTRIWPERTRRSPTPRSW
ncbi:MAG TPA: hypothetical protein VK548_07915 [Candidatus Acidoferrum sp.]|nr:hypothetical protein [Candidatus Acidoferrum sp.]